LQGSFSLALIGSANNVDRAFTASPEVWTFIEHNTGALTADQYPMVIRDGSGNNLCYVILTSTGALQIFDGSGSSSTGGGTVSANTSYYIWLHRLKGSGANGVADVYISTTTTKPGAATLSISNGSTTADAANIQIYNNGGDTMITDYLRVSTTVIGSAPL
jgi:hypothetical protein